ncbi:unnamed protein product [Moneuplotes crassus]|uniref:Uncharacterized protein n=1 Tax=Euplotes crassus TaxID=5936 RepID=A0AAD2D7Z7_EUPCR|nr:unnamed protein product [Moneuplotes crassus]
MEEKYPPYWMQNLQRDNRSSQDFYLSNKESESLGSARPPLDPQDLMSQQYTERQKYESKESAKRHDFNSPQSDLYSPPEGYSENNHYSLKKSGEERHHWRDDTSHKYDSLKSEEFKENPSMKPSELFSNKNYDTKDTIDWKLEELKSSIRKQEELQFADNDAHNLPMKKEEGFNFHNTFNPQQDQFQSQQKMQFHGYHKDFNQTDGNLFTNKNPELEDRLGIMKKAALNMKSEPMSNREKNYYAPRPQSRQVNDHNYESEQDGFESSTNNLIRNSNARINQIDEFMSTVKSKENQDLNTERELHHKYNQVSERNELNYDYEKTEIKYPQNSSNAHNYNLSQYPDRDQRNNRFEQNNIGCPQRTDSDHRLSGRIKPASVPKRDPVPVFHPKYDQENDFSQDPIEDNSQRLQIAPTVHDSHQDSPKKVNPSTSQANVTTNFMENELALLQKKIAGLEQKLTNNVSKTSTGGMKFTTNEHLNDSRSKEDSRFEINLEKYEEKAQYEKSHNESISSESILKSSTKKQNLRVNNNFDSEITQSNSKKTKSSRRAESVCVRTSRNNLQKANSTLSAKKNPDNNMAKRLRSKKSQMQSFEKSATKISNVKAKLDTSKEAKSTKSYMRPTNSSVKKSRKGSITNTLVQKVKTRARNDTLTLKEFAKHPNALLMLFKNMKSYHTQMLLGSPQNRAFQMLHFIFSPYMICMCIIMKHFMTQMGKQQTNTKRNAKIQVSKDKTTKEPKVDAMLLQLKNQELQEEKAKNAELRRHIEILKKRVYAKMEFEGQVKVVREAADMLDQLKAQIPTMLGNKCKKEQKDITKSLTSVLKKLKSKDKKSNSKTTTSKKLIKIENEENSSLVTNRLKSSEENFQGMKPKYHAYPTIDDTIKVNVKKKKLTKPKKESKVPKRHFR